MRAILLAAAASIILTGCASVPLAGGHRHRMASQDVGDLVYGATDILADRVDPALVRPDKPIIVATMVSVDNLDATTTFGRLSSQLILNRLAQRGYQVRDVTYTRGLDVNPTSGEVVLSRDAAKLSRSFGAQAVVAGTYAVAGRAIYLNIRMLSAADGSVKASSDVVIPLNGNTSALVYDEGERKAHRRAMTFDDFRS